MSGPVLADKGQLLDRLYALEIETYATSTQFHMFTFLEGDLRVATKIEKGLQQMQDRIPADEALPGDEALAALVNQVRLDFEPYRKAAQGNEIRTQGYTSVYAVSDLETAEQRLLNSLAVAQDYLDGSQPGLRHQLMSAAARVQKMASRYARLAAHWNGRTGLMADAEGDTIDVHATAFSQQLETLRSSLGDERLLEAEIKWEFISAKLIDYQNETVPYLVTRYSDSIVSRLMAVGADTAVELPALASN
ncbi:hypothetical protein D0544_02010 [Aestuariirhabdus litorea]|uniref:Uncharacterized protein n=2 Tax=Aestuariirhabdus litorea TaxID=2528527 RepID=A0A3P3VPR6_9GAMM|nr:hypothetical protein D0544_02010 [Aestuariirhabdus litorea]